MITNLQIGEEDYYKVWSNLFRYEDAPYHRLLGYPASLHNPVLNDNERLLLQLDTDKSIDMGWGDTGLIYFTIPEQDLVKENFQQVRAEYQGC